MPEKSLGLPPRRAGAVWALITAVSSVLLGCSVGPDYAHEPPRVPEAWSEGSARTQNQDLSEWWKHLEDPILDGLIERALRANRALSEARYRIVEARAQLAVVGGSRIPSLSASSEYEGSQRSENTGSASKSRHENLFGGGFDTFWELDFFGRIARQVEASQGDYETTLATSEALRITLLGDVARTYVSFRLAQRRLAIARANRESQARTLGLIQVRHEAGLVPELDLRQAERILSSTAAEIPSIEAERVALANALATLVGCYPHEIRSELEPERPVPNPQTTVDLGVPADLLRRRPDVRAAERTLASTTARVGIAVAELYPQFSLTGVLRLEAKAADLLPEGHSIRYTFGPSLRWNLFAGGSLRAQVRVEEARVAQARQRYEQSVLQAVEDVESAMVSHRRERERRVELARAVERASQSVSLSEAAYEEGLVDFQNVLDNQRTLLTLQDLLATNDAAITLALIRLYKALGGGWDWMQLAPDADNTQASGSHQDVRH